VDVMRSNVTPGQLMPAGMDSISVRTAITYRAIVTGFAVAELRQSAIASPASVVSPDADRVRMAQEIDQILANSVTRGRATRAVTGWDHLIQEIEFAFNGNVPAGMDSTGRRSVLAKWLADPSNPLTARVMVNRIWQDHFGSGIVGTTSDFGVMGDKPSNPELLDYLAATFVDGGWSVKKIQRLIMLSDTYQQSSAFQAEAAKVDPENKLMWRFNRRRLEGEVIRDSMLLASGNLNPAMGGPGVFPPLPDGTSRGSKYLSWKPEKNAAEANRRSVYVFVKRNLRYPMFEAFDFPDTHESCSRRFATVSPSQPLMLMNDELVREWSRALAARVLNDGGLSPDQQIERAYRIVFSRPPNAEERRTVLEFLDKQTAEAGDRKAAFVDLCQTLLNSNEFVYMN